MKKLELLTVSLIFLLAACGGKSFKKADGQYVDEEFNIQFREIGQNWQRQDPGVARKHGTIHYFFNNQNHARVWIRATRYENDPALPLKEGAESYVARKARQYSWADLKSISEGDDSFNGEKSFWKIYEYKLGSKEKREKIYRVHHEKIAYQFRLRCGRENFDDVLPEFDAWLESISFMK